MTHPPAAPSLLSPPFNPFHFFVYPQQQAHPAYDVNSVHAQLRELEQRELDLAAMSQEVKARRAQVGACMRGCFIPSFLHDPLNLGGARTPRPLLRSAVAS